MMKYGYGWLWAYGSMLSIQKPWAGEHTNNQVSLVMGWSPGYPDIDPQPYYDEMVFKIVMLFRGINHYQS